MKYLSLDVENLTRDFRVRTMTVEAFGGYVSLLFEAALADGPLPTDDDQLATISKLGPKAWKVHGPAIKAMGETEGETLRFPCVDQAVANWAAKRKQNARNANARWAGSTYRSKGDDEDQGGEHVDEGAQNDDLDPAPTKERKVSVKRDATALPTEGDRNPAVPSNGVKGKEKKDGSPVSGDRTYSKEFESFWSEYRSLGGSTEMPKSKSYQSWQAAKRRASVEEIMSGLQRYKDWLRAESGKAKEKGTRSPRDFVPMPTTWLNQSRWDSERKGEAKKKVVPEPVNGVDYYWGDKTDPNDGSTRTGRMKIGPNGERLEESFNLGEWYRQNGHEAEAREYEQAQER